MSSTTAALVADFWRDKSRGLLLGAACGDALAAAFLERIVVSDTAFRALDEADGPLRRTAVSTEMLAVAGDHARYRGAGDLEHSAVGATPAHQGRTERHRPAGVAPNPRLLDDRDAPESACASTSRDSRSVTVPPRAATCAPAVAAVLALLSTSTSRVAALAADSALATESDPVEQAAVTLHAVAVALVLGGDPFRELDQPRFLGRLSELADPHLTSPIAVVRRLADHAQPSDAAREFGTGSAAHQAVPTALVAFLRHPDNARSCLRFAIKVGGRSTATATLAGALSGARLGAAALPQHWLGRLDTPDALIAAADRLTARRGPRPD